MSKNPPGDLHVSIKIIGKGGPPQNSTYEIELSGPASSMREAALANEKLNRDIDKILEEYGLQESTLAVWGW